MQYDEYKNPMDNIGMQDSLLSRFDLLFIVLDQVRQALKKFIVAMNVIPKPFSLCINNFHCRIG